MAFADRKAGPVPRKLSMDPDSPHFDEWASMNVEVLIDGKPDLNTVAYDLDEGRRLIYADELHPVWPKLKEDHTPFEVRWIA